MTTTNAVDKKKIPGLFILITVFLFNLIVAPVCAALELEYPHWDGNYIDCGSCHTRFLKFGKYTPLNIDDTKPNNTCWSCHNDTDAIYVATHSSLRTDTRYGDWTVQCVVCHNQHTQPQSRVWRAAAYLYTGNSTEITTTTLTMTGADWLDDAYASLILTPNKTQLGYSYKIVTNTANTLTVQGPMDLAYVNPGDTFFITYGKLIRTPINNEKSTEPVLVKRGNKRVRFFNATGPNSFADGDATYDGICEVCHTQTTHFRNDGSGSDQYHDNIGGAQGTKCTTCHNHRNGFAHGGGGVGCDQCHGHDAGYGGVTGGKGTFQSHSTHTENDTDDVKGPNLACNVCHDTNNFPAFADGQTSLAATTVCDSCHSPGGTYDGLNDPTVGAKTIWHSGAYVATDDSTLTAGKEKWCATCHDEAPSVIQAIAAPNVIGDESGNYTYGTGWGYYKTGHGLDSSQSYPASGGVVLGGGKECSDCHDYSTAHIDGKARSYDCTDDDPTNDADAVDQDCNSTEYQQGYRLKLVDDQNPMEMSFNSFSLNQDNYRLCFSSNGCHIPDKYLTTSTEFDTSFRDDQGWKPTNVDYPAPVNAHQHHLRMNYRFRTDWRATTRKTTVSCVTCHNVHGSTQLAMVRDGKLTDREPGMKVLYTDTVEEYPDSALGPITANSEVFANQPVTLANSTGTFWDSNTSDKLCSDCHGNPLGGGYIYPRTSTPLAQEPPTLSWTGETDYETDGVYPDSAPSGTYFLFRVNYTDANFDLPTVIQVWVDTDGNNSYGDDEKFDLFEVDSSDRNCSDGKLYNKTMTINFAGEDGTLMYRFYAKDRNAVATGNPVTGGTITLTKDIPVLTWSGEQGYTADGVSPDSGAAGSSFVFRINYTQADNAPPTSIQVWVNLNNDEDYDLDEKVDLIADDNSDNDYSNGKLYMATVAIPYTGDGTLNYRFYASNDEVDAIGTPTANRSLTVTNGNTAPVLAWTGATNYVTDGVDPDTGMNNTDFTFQVQYSDAENTTPSSIQLWVDINDDDDYDDSGEKIDLIAVDATDTDYSDGKFYAATINLAVAGDGLINYRFHASDGTVDATGIPANDSIVTLLVNAIKVSCDGTGDYDYTSLQAAIDDATNDDTILLASGTCTENITINNKDLTIVSSGGADSTFIDGNASGTVVQIINGSDMVLNGVTVQNGYLLNGYGAGISISDSSPTIVNSIITDNTSQYGGGLYVSGNSSTMTISETTVSSNTCTLTGPGIFLASGSSAVISGSTISNNTTLNGHGGGLYMTTTSGDASLTISGSTISGNAISHSGGGIYINASGGTVSLSIDATTISGNSGQQGGAMYIIGSGSTFTGTVTDSTISSNTSTLSGGGLSLLALDSMTITGTTFNNNSSATGGAFMVVNEDGNTLTISDSTIRDNNATLGSGSYGGGLRLSGGTVIIERSFFTGNSARWAGGVYISGNTTASIRNCAITGNKTTDFTGGGLSFSGQDAVLVADIVNCTISGNDAGTTGGAVEVANDATATVTVTNSIIYGNGGSNQINGTVIVNYSDISEDGYSGNNNINVDPLFVDPRSSSLAPTSEGDYHLQVSSQAVNTGTSVDAPAVDIDNDLRPSGAGFDMGADEVMIVLNSSPNLEWTGETGYGADGVDPGRGISGAAFEFRITYVDTDNDAPTVIQLWVDENDNHSYEADEKYTMSAVNGEDITYRDGKLYTKSLNLVYAGDDVLNYRFYAVDSYNVATGEPVADNTIFISSVPQLAWLGSGDYVADGANPDSGLVGSDFVFRVTYTDAHNTPPTSIQVWVDRNNDGDYVDSAEMLTMTALSSTDTDYTDGKIYTRTITLAKAEDNTLNYRFYSANGNIATGDPTTTTSTVTLINNIPTLAWTNLTNYTEDGVDPDYGLSGTLYDFQVKYTDADNVAPASIQLWLDKNDTNNYDDPGEKIDMVPVDPTDLTYSDGKLYKVQINLNAAAEGDGFINYSFRAGDGTNTATGTPTSDFTLGVFTANPPPELDWTGESGYTADGVDPDSGPGGGVYTFRVRYTQLLDIAPSAIQVWVDKNNDGDYLDDGEKIDLIAVESEDTAYSDGKLYTVAITVPYVVGGSVQYLFSASDGTSDATGAATAEQTMTVVEAVVVGTTIQDAINAAADGQIVLVGDGTYSENIVFPTDKSVTVQSIHGAEWTTIQGSGANAAVVTIGSGESYSQVLDGFTIDNQGTDRFTRGILVDNLAAPTIMNCIIQGNELSNGSGGGLYLTGASTTNATTLLNTTVTGNTATVVGAGIYCLNSKLAISGGSISGNTSTLDGAGLYLSGSSTTVTISGSTLNDNHARNGVALYAKGTGALTISDSTIDSNTGTSTGAGLYVSAMLDTTTVTNVSVTNNTSGATGGGIFFSSVGTSLSITNSNIDNNTASLYDGGGLYIGGDATTTATLTGGSFSGNAARNGGGIFITGGPSVVASDVDISGNHYANSSGSGSGISVGGDCSLDISGSTIRGNRAAASGGGIVNSGTVTLTNCIVSGNIAELQSYSDGGGIYSYAGILNVYNSTISGNYAKRRGGGLRCSDTSTIINSIIWGNTAGVDGTNISGTPTITYSDVQDGYTGTGNIDANPWFVDFQQAGLGGPTSGGVFLLCNGVDNPVGCTYVSPCIDSASATSAPGDDIEGDSRPYDVEERGDGVDEYDMGADEYVPTLTNPPVLNWSGEAAYITDGVDPDSGMGGDNFIFRIDYADPDNDPASSVQVWLDVDDSGTYEINEKFAMTEVDSDDTTYSDGKLYTKPLAIDYAGDGVLNYRFYAADGIKAATSADPLSDSVLTVTAPNDAPPSLSWLGSGNYVSDGVDHDTDVDGSTFTFQIQYSDADNNSPSSIQIWVDRNDDGDYLDPDEQIDLTAMDGNDLDYTDGKLYFADVSIDLYNDGIITYRFYASDGTNATGPPTEDDFVTLFAHAIRVSCPGTGVYDYTSLQSAIDNASNGEVILVNDGTCIETITIDNKNLTIRSVNGADVTIIDSSGAYPVATFRNGADSVLDGLTVTGADSAVDFAAGVVINNSSPTIVNSIITGNTSKKAGGIYVSAAGSTVTITNSTLSANACSLDGGALYLDYGTSAVISNTLFHDNSAGDGSGGAIYMKNWADDASLTLSGSTFTQNTAESLGGAIYAFNYIGTLSVDISNSTFTASDTTDAGTIAATRNASNNKGGVMYMSAWAASTVNLTISDSTVEYGDATVAGGGMFLRTIDSTTITGSTFANNSSASAGFLQYDLNTSDSSITFTDSKIRDNFSTGINNGALYMNGGSIFFDKCSITGNSAPKRGGGGTISGNLRFPTVTTIQNSIVIGNKASFSQGGAFRFVDDGNNSHTVNIINSTFSGNYAGSYGGAICQEHTAEVTITNSIFRQNWAGSGDYEINGTVTASYSDINQAGYEGNDNVNIDPLFVAPVSYTSAPTSSGNYHLQAGSPVIDIGSSTGAPSDDIDGDHRPQGAGIDMGADELLE